MIGGKLHSIDTSFGIKQWTATLSAKPRRAHFYSDYSILICVANKPGYNAIYGERRRVWVSGICPFNIIRVRIMFEVVELRERIADPA